MTRPDLLALAERVEQATGADDDIAMEIVWLDYDTPGGIGLGVNYDPDLWMERYGLDPTASLDAAAYLLPEGWHISAMHQRWEDGRWEVEVARLPSDAQRAAYAAGRTFVVHSERSEAATGPLALCGAALRARGV